MGFKELEIVFDKFLTKYLKIFSLDDLVELDVLLQHHDQEIYEYIYNNKDLYMKPDNKMLGQIVKFINSTLRKA